MAGNPYGRDVFASSGQLMEVHDGSISSHNCSRGEDVMITPFLFLSALHSRGDDTTLIVVFNEPVALKSCAYHDAGTLCICPSMDQGTSLPSLRVVTLYH